MLGVVAACALAGCHHRRERLPLMDEVIEERIVHGVVTFAGDGATGRIMLQTAAGPLRLIPSRADSLALERIAGDEIAARGVEGREGLRLERFTVLSVDGVAVLDGVVRADGSGFLLETQGRRVRLGNPPAAFKVLVGARVWVAGAPDTGPIRYGVIQP